MSVVESTNEISYPYAVISDVHCHNWSAFSHTNERGINNRLQHILDAIELAADTLWKAGGNDLVITGDLFHTRGNIKPSVLNPTYDTFAQIAARGITIHAIPGNHDLEGTNSDRLGSAMTTLAGIEGFNVYDKPTKLASNHLFIPWFEDYRKVQNLATKRVRDFSNLTLFCHVGLNNVLPHYVGDCINPDDLLKEDFKYVFSGHFHNHVSFDSRVYSVGALTHQSWRDVGSLAGFLIVYEDRVEHYGTNAPKFVDVEDADLPLDVTVNNYIRLRNVTIDEEEADVARQFYLRRGAAAFVDESTRPTMISKSYTHNVDVDLGLENALEAYCKNTFGDRWKEVLKECLRLKSG